MSTRPTYRVDKIPTEDRGEFGWHWLALLCGVVVMLYLFNARR